MPWYDSILSVGYSILKSHIIMFGILLILYIIEVNSDFRFFIKQFKWKKSIKNAEIFLDRDSGSYFIFVFIVFVYDTINGYIVFSFITVLVWFIIMIPLIKLFRKYYSKYQGINPNKADDDYT